VHGQHTPKIEIHTQAREIHLPVRGWQNGAWRPTAETRNAREHGGQARCRAKQEKEDRSRFERTGSKTQTGSRLKEAGEAAQCTGEVEQQAEER